jgi:hypothetical protein
MCGNGATQIAYLSLRGTIVLLVTPAAVELSVWIGLFGWGQLMVMRVWRWGIISCAVMNIVASSDSAAKAMTNLIILAIDRKAPLNQGKGSSSNRMSAPTLLQELVLLSISMGTKYHVTCSIDYAIIWIGSCWLPKAFTIKTKVVLIS